MTTNQLKLRRMLVVCYGLAKKHYHGHTLTLIVMVNEGYGKENFSYHSQTFALGMVW